MKICSTLLGVVTCKMKDGMSTLVGSFCNSHCEYANNNMGMPMIQLFGQNHIF
jgi:hypothetical protein